MEARESGGPGAALRGGLIGSPETIARKLRRFRSSHIDQVILLNQAGKNSHEHISGSSLELFAKGIVMRNSRRSRARRLEGRGDERGDQARGDRHPSLHRPLWQAGGERRSGKTERRRGRVAARERASASWASRVARARISRTRAANQRKRLVAEHRLDDDVAGLAGVERVPAIRSLHSATIWSASCMILSSL